MSERKNQQKPLVLFREAVTYSATWAYRLADVPLYDPVRGFPLSEPPSTLEVVDGEALSALKDVDPLVRGAHEQTLEVLRRVLDEPKWLPAPTPKSGYPWLVRRDLEPTRDVRQAPGNRRFLNDLAALTRWAYSAEKPDKRLLKEVEALHIQAGPVLEKQNTLGAWYALARAVQAHFNARGALHLIGLEELRAARGELHSSYREALKSRDSFLISTYRLLYQTARVATDATGFESAVAQMLRGKLTLNVRPVADGLLLRCPLFDWVQLELAEFWVSERPKECPGCGRWFWPTQVDTEHCHDRCRLRKRATKTA